MISQIYWGTVDHWRAKPNEHSFTYPTFTFALNIRELLSIATSRCFGFLFRVDKRGIYSLRTREYMKGKKDARTNLEGEIRTFYDSQNVSQPAKVSLVTMPRMLGYVFNPVNFYIGQSDGDFVESVIAEVNNTFGETNIYLMGKESQDSASDSNLSNAYKFNKELFVSPFFDTSGRYHLEVKKFAEEMEIIVSLEKQGEIIFCSRLYGKGRELNSKNLIYTLFRYPFVPFLTMLRIHVQAYVLYRRKKTPLNAQPKLVGPNSSAVKPGIFHRLRSLVILKLRSNH